jgi:phospholipid N-methyltransferase
MDAENCLKQFQAESVDLVVSTLPLWSMNPIHAREIIAAAAKSLNPEWIFLQYQYFATNRDDIEQYFTLIDTDWEPINFPPAFIYICKKR